MYDYVITHYIFPMYCAQKYAVAAYIIPDPDPNPDPDLYPTINLGEVKH
jgi:hypothetical protein